MPSGMLCITVVMCSIRCDDGDDYLPNEGVMSIYYVGIYICVYVCVCVRFYIESIDRFTCT